MDFYYVVLGFFLGWLLGVRDGVNVCKPKSALPDTKWQKYGG